MGKPKSGWRQWKDKCPDPRCDRCGGKMKYIAQDHKIEMFRIDGMSVCGDCYKEIREKKLEIKVCDVEYRLMLVKHKGVKWVF